MTCSSVQVHADIYIFFFCMILIQGREVIFNYFEESVSKIGLRLDTSN